MSAKQITVVVLTVAPIPEDLFAAHVELVTPYRATEDLARISMNARTGMVVA